MMLIKSLLSLISIAFFVACQGDFSTETYTVAKPTPKPSEVLKKRQANSGMDPNGVTFPSETNQARAGIGWDVPKGWMQTSPKTMRLANFVLKNPKNSKQEAVDISVTVLPSSIGGMLDNANRWREQIGLLRADPSSLQNSIRIDQSELGRFEWISLLNTTNDQGIYAAVFQIESAKVFVKVTGAASALRTLKSDFLAFCRSLKKSS